MCPLRLVPPASPVGIIQHHWIDPTNTLRDFTYETSTGLFVSKGATGLGDVDVDLATDKTPFAPGAQVRHIAVPPREMRLPIFAREDSIGDLVLVADAVRTWFATGDERRLTPGYYRVTRPDDSVRQIQCYRTGGLAGDLTQGGPTHLVYLVELLAPDPFPTDAEDTTHTYGQADLDGDELIIINDGELDAFPIWTIRGPWSSGTPSILVHSVTSDESFAFDFAIGNHAEGVIVDTRPPHARPTIGVRRFSDGLNLFPFLTQRNLWWLAPGENRFELTVVGATSETTIELAYRRRYRGLLR